MSEIDDIFAFKDQKKEVPLPLKVSPSSSSSIKKEKTRKNKKKKADDALTKTQESASSSKKRPLPETVVDTSHRVEGHSKRQKVVAAHDEDKKSRRSKVGDMKNDADADFKDSRGTGNQQGRTTEEGWSVYKEDELGIGDQGGDTPLCPFDCDCCF